jgi:hypothetical protein
LVVYIVWICNGLNPGHISPFDWKKRPNSLRRVALGRRGQGAGAGREAARSQKNIKKAAESHKSAVRFVGQSSYARFAD